MVDSVAACPDTPAKIRAAVVTLGDADQKRRVSSSEKLCVPLLEDRFSSGPILGPLIGGEQLFFLVHLVQEGVQLNPARGRASTARPPRFRPPRPCALGSPQEDGAGE
jgi:hypothetical protein